ncbi:MAG TPA: tetratricopeptide repeat protein [Permianibacter sp.]|nr:tetratricopeptide repeat protein [Permianibacter sp.]
MPLRTFLAELKRRRVSRVAVVYAVVGFGVIQVANNIFPPLALPAWTTRLVILLVLLGFPLALVLAWALELTPEGLRFTTQVDRKRRRPAPSAHWGWKRHAAAYVAVTVLGAGSSVLIYRWWQAPGNTITISERPAIAVLPFDSWSHDPEHLAFTHAMHDIVLTQLAKIQGLAVISRTSVLRYQHERPSVAEIADTLQVDYLIEGSVFRDQQRVRLQIQLIDADTDRHLWAESYERPLTDVFATQNEVAEKISAQLGVKLRPIEQQALREHATTNTEAYAHYVSGKSAVAARDNEAAHAALDQAVQLDPQFAAAWAWLAITETLQGWDDPGVQEHALTQANRSLAIAERLQPTAAETLLARAIYHYLGQHDFAAAEPYFVQALAQQPNEAASLSYFGFMRRRQGRLQEAVHLLEQAMRLDPLSATSQDVLCNVYLGLKQRQQALSCHADASKRFPDVPFIQGSHNQIRHLLFTHDFQQLVADQAAVAAKHPDSVEALIMYGSALLWAGQPERAVALIQTSARIEGLTDHLRAFFTGIVYTFAKQPEKARVALQRASALFQADSNRTVQPAQHARLLADRALVEAFLGNRDLAISLAEQAVITQPRELDVTEWGLRVWDQMRVHAWLGDTDRVLTLTQAMFAEHVLIDPQEVWYDFLLPAELRREPRFRKMMQQLGADVSRPMPAQYSSAELNLTSNSPEPLQ